MNLQIELKKKEIVVEALTAENTRLKTDLVIAVNEAKIYQQAANQYRDLFHQATKKPLSTGKTGYPHTKLIS